MNWVQTDYRMYDSQLGRFHAIDPLTDFLPSINPYQYSYNNPVSYSDPSGLLPEEETQGRKMGNDNEPSSREPGGSSEDKPSSREPGSSSDNEPSSREPGNSSGNDSGSRGSRSSNGGGNEPDNKEDSKVNLWDIIKDSFKFVDQLSGGPEMRRMMDKMANPKRSDYPDNAIGALLYEFHVYDNMGVPLMGGLGSETKTIVSFRRLADGSSAAWKSRNARDVNHYFSKIIDNYTHLASKFTLKGGDGMYRSLYQIEGSLNGRSGVFEWIVETGGGATHRAFIPGGKVTGIPNQW